MNGGHQRKSNLAGNSTCIMACTNNTCPLLAFMALKPQKGGRLDQYIPIGWASFHVLGVFLTSCVWIVKSREKGCVRKSTTENWMWRGNLTLFVVT